MKQLKLWNRLLDRRNVCKREPSTPIYRMRLAKAQQKEGTVVWYRDNQIPDTQGHKVLEDIGVLPRQGGKTTMDS